MVTGPTPQAPAPVPTVYDPNMPAPVETSRFQPSLSPEQEKAQKEKLEKERNEKLARGRIYHGVGELTVQTPRGDAKAMNNDFIVHLSGGTYVLDPLTAFGLKLKKEDYLEDPPLYAESKADKDAENKAEHDMTHPSASSTSTSTRK